MPDEAVASEHDGFIALAKSRGPFENRGNLGDVMRDLAEKSFGRHTSRQGNDRGIDPSAR